MKNENPYLSSNRNETMNAVFGPGHPARQELTLTQLQQAHLPALLWLFDTNRYRGQGRTVLLAYVALELARRGESVELDDVSVFLTGQRGERIQRTFAEQVMKLATKWYPRERFNYNHATNLLTYYGKHPQ